jgi:hypothetical protein
MNDKKVLELAVKHEAAEQKLDSLKSKRTKVFADFLEATDSGQEAKVTKIRKELTGCDLDIEAAKSMVKRLYDEMMTEAEKQIQADIDDFEKNKKTWDDEFHELERQLGNAIGQAAHIAGCLSYGNLERHLSGLVRNTMLMDSKFSSDKLQQFVAEGREAAKSEVKKYDWETRKQDLSRLHALRKMPLMVKDHAQRAVQAAIGEIRRGEK